MFLPPPPMFSGSKPKLPKRSPNGTQDYSCTLYLNYLILYGGKDHNNYPFGEVCVYNLNQKRMEDNQLGIIRSCPSFSHSACVKEDRNMIIFYGGRSSEEDRRQQGEQTNNNILLIQRGGGQLGWNVLPELMGPFMPSPISHIDNNKMFVYQPGEENGNFGTLECFSFEDSRWLKPRKIKTNDMRLYEPSRNVIFSDGVLYVFAENTDQPRKARQVGSSFIEDVYLLDTRESNIKLNWERVSCSDEAPGCLKNLSLAEANGMIYVFGLGKTEDGAEKSVLWVFNTNEKEWGKIQEIGTLTARPNQRAVVYNNQLLIVDWSYSGRAVEIQYQNLDGLNIVREKLNKKQRCKDQPEDLIKDAKNIYNGRLFADITFEVEGEEIPCHKAILAYRSNYFMRMFTSGMSESHSSKISIPNMKVNIFKALLQYIYCNEVELDEKLALDLIPVVDEYLMKDLKGLCEKYLCKQLRKDNVVDILIVADRHEIEELKKACFRFILKNLGNIDENEEMMKLSKLLFLELLKFSQNLTNESNSHNQDFEDNSSVGFTNGFGVPLLPRQKALLTKKKF